ncbi:MAG TPA: LysR family transcriptional regulator [Stellaceae bacterium]|nr:LysR family transcriptional regulator [Stellaceae bacterium]
MDRLEAMSAFVAVVKAGSFSGAARQLGVPLATVSRRVADLEAELSARLLHRTTRMVSLTDQGRTYYAASARILDDVKDAAESVSGEYRVPKGHLTVTAPVGFGRLHLQPVALAFLAAYAEINLRLTLVDRIVNLVEEHVDAAVRIAELADSSLIARPLGHVRIVLCASPDYLARHGAPKHPRDLETCDCIAWSALGPLDAWWFREAGADRTFPIRVRLSTTIAETALAAAEAGLGLVQTTSYQAEQGVREGRLVVLLPEFECATTPVSLVYATNRLLPLKLRAFIDFAVPRLEERLQSIAKAMAPGAASITSASAPVPPPSPSPLGSRQIGLSPRRASRDG